LGGYLYSLIGAIEITDKAGITIIRISDIRESFSI
jgi:hypothetical protein